MAQRVVPSVASEDSDDVVVALETARVQEERGDSAGAYQWLQKAAVAARKQGRPNRAGELSRAAARFEPEAQAPAKKSRFERRPDAEQVLRDADEYSEETIVDSVATLRKEDQSASKHVLPAGTPVIAGASKLDVPQHLAIRVAVRRSLGGRFEARPLGADESAGTGEQEALLVPLRPGAKLT